MNKEKIKLCLAGCTGWTSGAVARQIMQSGKFTLTGAVATKTKGQDIGLVHNMDEYGLLIDDSVEAALDRDKPDVLIEYTSAATVKDHVYMALDRGINVIVGSSGLTENDFEQIEKIAKQKNIGVIACGNYAITAALAKKFATIAAEYIPQWEILDYAEDHKPDAPAGTTREIAEALAQVRQNRQGVEIENVIGMKEARGAQIKSTPVHSIRLPGYTFSFEVIFGQQDERLHISQQGGGGAEPYVAGTLLATEKVMNINGLIRGMDNLLFKE